jgi:probable blue pigment (indigoidine) exporter
VQPLVVVFLAAWVLGSALRPASVLGALAGLAGVALLVLTPGVRLDATGIAAGLASGFHGLWHGAHAQVARSRTAADLHRLAAHGRRVLLLPVALWAGPDFPAPTPAI